MNGVSGGYLGKNLGPAELIRNLVPLSKVRPSSNDYKHETTSLTFLFLSCTQGACSLSKSKLYFYLCSPHQGRITSSGCSLAYLQHSQRRQSFLVTCYPWSFRCDSSLDIPLEIWTEQLWDEAGNSPKGHDAYLCRVENLSSL